jgi:hypothetical protein
MGIGSGLRSAASGASSATRGLIPKSTGGRVAMGAGAGLGVEAGVAGYRKRSSGRNQAFNFEPGDSDVFGPSDTGLANSLRSNNTSYGSMVNSMRQR